MVLVVNLFRMKNVTNRHEFSVIMIFLIHHFFVAALVLALISDSKSKAADGATTNDLTRS